MKLHCERYHVIGGAIFYSRPGTDEQHEKDTNAFVNCFKAMASESPNKNAHTIRGCPDLPNGNRNDSLSSGRAELHSRCRGI